MVNFLIFVRCSTLIENAISFALDNCHEKDNINESK